MLSYEGLPVRRIEQTTRGWFHIECVDRTSYVVPLCRIGADRGVEEVLTTARLHPGEVLEFCHAPRTSAR